jgi:hypothetical protein
VYPEDLEYPVIPGCLVSLAVLEYPDCLKNPEYLEHLVSQQHQLHLHPEYPADLAILEYPADLEYLGFLVYLEYPEFQFRLVNLARLVYLEYPVYLGYPDDLGYLGYPELLAVPAVPEYPVYL